MISDRANVQVRKGVESNNTKTSVKDYMLEAIPQITNHTQSNKKVRDKK